MAPLLVNLRDTLVRLRNADGGWGYAAGRASRIEPTCWSLLAVSRTSAQAALVDVLLRWSRHAGWLVDVPGAPVNYTFNALAALTLLTHPTGKAEAQRIALQLLDVRGLKFPQGKEMRQDNSLQAWSWIDSTFSWVEPTSVCLLLIKKLRRDLPAAAANDRIDIAERMLRDRACAVGGWNYGGSNVYGQELFPYVPTTALGLLAMQDHATDPIVRRAVDWMLKDAASEASAHAMGLASIALGVHGTTSASLTQSLTKHLEAKGAEYGALGLAAGLYAISRSAHGEAAFAL